MQQQPPFVSFNFGNPGLYDVNFKLNFEMRGQTTNLAFQGIRHYQPQSYQATLDYRGQEIQNQGQGYGTVSGTPKQGQGGRCRRHNVTACRYRECQQEEEPLDNGGHGGVPSNSWSYAGQQQQFAGNTSYSNRTSTGSNQSGVTDSSFLSGIEGANTSSPLTSTPRQSCFQNKRCGIF